MDKVAFYEEVILDSVFRKEATTKDEHIFINKHPTHAYPMICSNTGLSIKGRNSSRASKLEKHIKTNSRRLDMIKYPWFAEMDKKLKALDLVE